MPVIINGTTGISGVDGSAGTPSYQGGDTNTGVFFPAADVIAFSTNGTEDARFDSAGNFGIGTSSPAGRLHVVGTSDQIRCGNGTNTAFLGASGSSGYTGTLTNDPFLFYTNSAERMRIDSSGNVGIGTASPVSRLDVRGDTNIGTSATPGTTYLNVRNSNAVEIDSYIGTTLTSVVNYCDSTQVITGSQTSIPYIMRTNGSERVRISANGSRQFTTQNANTIYAGDATFTLSNSTVTFDLATVFPDLVGNGAGMGIMLLINQWSGAPNTGITQLTLGQKSSGWTFSTIATTGSGTGSSVSGSGTVITVTSGSGFGQIRVWVTSRN